jgi:serine protease Do
MEVSMYRQLIGQAEPAVRAVHCRDFSSSGSGFFITSDGHFVTNNHVVTKRSLQSGYLQHDYSKRIVVVIDGNVHPAELVIDQESFHPIVYDYAILKVGGISNASCLEVNESPEDVRRGDEIVCLGFPLDFRDLVATNGIVSAIVRSPSHRNEFHQMNTILTNAVIQFGNSGGPMLDVKTGKVIGINTRKHSVEDQLRKRLETYLNLKIPYVRDMAEYILRFADLGLNHAVSIEYVLGDPASPL